MIKFVMRSDLNVELGRDVRGILVVVRWWEGEVRVEVGRCMFLFFCVVDKKMVMFMVDYENR